MKNEFSYDELKNKYSKRVGNFRGRDVIVRSKYDVLGDNVYILYDAEGMLPSAPPRGFPLVVDGYVVAYVNENGDVNKCKEFRWVPLKRNAELDTSSTGRVKNDVIPEEIKVDMSLVDSLLDRGVSTPPYLPSGYLSADDILNSVFK